MKNVKTQLVTVQFFLQENLFLAEFESETNVSVIKHQDHNVK